MPAANERTGPSILIVDDEYGFGEMLRDVLADVGYAVTLAINGERALDSLRDKTVDVLLADVMMPVMDGVALARALRDDPRHRGTRVVLMTSLPSILPAEDELCDAVLEKPFTPEHLLTTLAAVCSCAKFPRA